MSLKLAIAQLKAVDFTNYLMQGQTARYVFCRQHVLFTYCCLTCAGVLDVIITNAATWAGYCCQGVDHPVCGGSWPRPRHVLPCFGQQALGGHFPRVWPREGHTPAQTNHIPQGGGLTKSNN